MKFSEFRQYRPKPPDNVFVFICGDEFLIEQSREIWTGMFAGKWVVEKLQAKEFDEIESSRLTDEALTPSLFSESRLFMVTGAEKLKKSRIDDLIAIHGIANSSLKVILVVGGAKAGESLAKMFPTVGIDEMKPADAARWLVDRYKVAPNIARYLVENVGTDLYQLHNEIQKLETYVGGLRMIEERDVDVLILRSEQFGPWELDDSLLAANYTRAVRVVGAMIEEGSDPQQILGKIARVWRQLFVGKGYAKKGAADAAAAAGVPAFKASALAAGCNKYGWKQLARGFRDLLDADRMFKTSSPNPETSFDILLWKLVERK